MKSTIRYIYFVCGIISLSSTAFVNRSDIDPINIINKYIQAIGGKENVDKLKTIHCSGSVLIVESGVADPIDRLKLTYDSKGMGPNKHSIIVSANGDIISKDVFDGVTGYKKQPGSRAELIPDDVKGFKVLKGIIPQEFYGTSGYSLLYKGTTTIDNRSAYIIEVTPPSGNKITEYYDSLSCLLVRQDIIQNEVPLTLMLGDYRSVNNVLFPYK